MSNKYQRPSGAYAGGSGLSNTTKYQDDAGATPKVAISSSKMDGDFNYVVDGLNSIDTASGSRASIADRLGVSFNDDGTLKGSITATIDDWVEDTVTGLVRVDASTFQIDGDQTALYNAGRRVKLTIVGGYLYANVASSTFGTSATTVAMVDVVDDSGNTATLDEHPSAVSYSFATVGLTGNSQNMFAEVKVRNSSPVVRLKDTGGSEFGVRSVGSKMEFVENTGTEASPTWVARGSVSSSGIEQGDGTAGEIPTWDASGVYSKISAGTSGQVLTSNGAGAEATFADLPASTDFNVAGTGLSSSGNTVSADVGTTANKLVQLDASAKLPAVDGSQLTNLPSSNPTVVNVVKTDVFTSTSSTFADVTNLSATITPSDSSKKVLVIVSLAMNASGGGAALGRILRGTTVVGAGDTAGSREPCSFYSQKSNSQGVMPMSFSFLDSPATASAVTYKVQVKTDGTVYVNKIDADSDAGTTPRLASSITLMEV